MVNCRRPTNMGLGPLFLSERIKGRSLAIQAGLDARRV